MKLQRASTIPMQQLLLSHGSNNPRTRSSCSTTAPLPQGSLRAHVQPIARPGLRGLEREMGCSAAPQSQLGAAGSLWTTHPDVTKPTQGLPLLRMLLSPSHLLHGLNRDST